MALTRVLLVCQANICRSPMALVVTSRLAAQAQLAQHVQLDSAGTHAVPRSRTDARATAALARHGYLAPHLRARSVVHKDFEYFDLILAMDQGNLEVLRARCPAAHRHKINLFLAFAYDTPEIEIPDPYFGSQEGFEKVLQLCEAGARGLLASYAQKTYQTW